MKKTVFPSALFGICSTALLLMGLTSLRTPYSVLAQGEVPHSVSLGDDAAAEFPNEGDLPSRGGSEETPEQVTFKVGDKRGSAPVLEGFSLELPGTSAEPVPAATAYRYYYRFVPQGGEFGTLARSESWAHAAIAPPQHVASAPHGTAVENLAGHRSVGSERPNDFAEYSYSFVDEYSPEEAARYEMAQENRSDDAGSPGSLEIAEDGYFPWYQKYYYLMTPQAEVGRPVGRYELPEDRSLPETTSQESPSPQSGAGRASGPAWVFEGGHSGPDYEADVAAAWLFAASRQMPGAVQAAPADLAMTPPVGAETSSEALPDEAYEDWQALSDVGVEEFAEGSPDPAGGQSREMEEEWGPSTDNRTRDGLDAYGDYEGSGTWGPWYEGMEFQEDAEQGENGAGARGVAAPVDNGEAPAMEPNNQAGTWSLVNPEPLVAHPPIPEAWQHGAWLDTPLHGEPGEGFAWPQSEDQSGISDEAERNIGAIPGPDPDAEAEAHNVLGVPESAWDLEKPGYRLGPSEPPLRQQMDRPISDSAGNLGAEEPPETSEVGESSEATYEGDYVPGDYRWETVGTLIEEDAVELGIEPPVADSPPTEEAEGVSLYRLIRGLSEAAKAALPLPRLPEWDTIDRWY